MINFNHLLNKVLDVPSLIQRVAEHTGYTDTMVLQELIQQGVDEEQLRLFTVGKGEAARLFVTNTSVRQKNMKTVPRLIRKDEWYRRRSMAPEGQIMGVDLSPTYTKAVNYLSMIRYQPNAVVLQLMEELQRDDFFDDIRNKMELLMMAEFRTYGTGPHLLPMFPDHRYRVYTDSSGVASYQGGDWHRAICDFAEAKPVNGEDIHYTLPVIASEYNVTEDNYRQILDAGVEFIKNPSDFGINKKPACSYRAALAIKEMRETGKTAYIVQQDQSASAIGYYSYFTGDVGAAKLSNFLPSKDKQCFYTAAAEYVKHGELLPEDCRGHSIFFEKTTGKAIIIPMVYSAANASQTRGLILDKPQTDGIKFVDSTGVYIPGSLDNHPEESFNPQYAEILKGMGWDLAVRVASDVARAYEIAVFDGLTCHLRTAMTSIKKASRVANKAGRKLTWESPSGCHIVNRKLVVDKDAERCTININHDGRRHRISFLPVTEECSDSAAPPNFIHSVDASTVHNTAVSCELCPNTNETSWCNSIHCQVGENNETCEILRSFRACYSHHPVLCCTQLS